MKLNALNSMGIIGYGEVGKTFAAGLKTKPDVISMAVWDSKFAQSPRQDSTQDMAQAEQLAHATRAGVQPCASMRALCEASTFLSQR